MINVCLTMGDHKLLCPTMVYKFFVCSLTIYTIFMRRITRRPPVLQDSESDSDLETPPRQRRRNDVLIPTPPDSINNDDAEESEGEDIEDTEDEVEDCGQDDYEDDGFLVQDEDDLHDEDEELIVHNCSSKIANMILPPPLVLQPATSVPVVASTTSSMPVVKRGRGRPKGLVDRMTLIFYDFILMMITCFYIIIGSANVLNNSLPIIIMNNGSGGGDAVQEHVLPANILPAEDRPIGDPSFLENSFSLTVMKFKSDIDVNVLFILENFLKLYCTKGILL